MIDIDSSMNTGIELVIYNSSFTSVYCIDCLQLGVVDAIAAIRMVGAVLR